MAPITLLTIATLVFAFIAASADTSAGAGSQAHGSLVKRSASGKILLGRPQARLQKETDAKEASLLDEETIVDHQVSVAAGGTDDVVVSERVAVKGDCGGGSLYPNQTMWSPWNTIEDVDEAVCRETCSAATFHFFGDRHDHLKGGELHRSLWPKIYKDCNFYAHNKVSSECHLHFYAHNEVMEGFPQQLYCQGITKADCHGYNNCYGTITDWTLYAKSGVVAADYWAAQRAAKDVKATKAPASPRSPRSASPPKPAAAKASSPRKAAHAASAATVAASGKGAGNAWGRFRAKGMKLLRRGRSRNKKAEHQDMAKKQ